jgi:hypothetical protein
MAVAGFVEHAGTSQVSGWAYDSSSPAARLEVTVRIGDAFYASGYADIARNDLLAAGIGDGRHGFVIDVSEARFSRDQLEALEIHAISGVEVVKIERVHSTLAPLTDLMSEASMPLCDPNQSPIFVLGPARSATSAVTLALLESGSCLGMGEGHLLPLAHTLLSEIDRHYQRAGHAPSTMLSQVPSEAFQKFVRRAFVRLVADLFPTSRWVDKTPTVEMVRASVLMRELWPNARFIFMKRRVVENVLSRRRKFPQGTTESHFGDWAAVMTAWLAVRDALGGAALEVDHRQLVLDPKTAAASIAAFLHLPEVAGLRFAHYLGASRPQQTDEDFGAIYTIDHLELSEYETRRLRELCDGVMGALGYGYGAEYYRVDN